MTHFCFQLVARHGCSKTKGRLFITCTLAQSMLCLSKTMALWPFTWPFSEARDFLLKSCWIGEKYVHGGERIRKRTFWISRRLMERSRYYLSMKSMPVLRSRDMSPFSPNLFATGTTRGGE